MNRIKYIVALLFVVSLSGCQEQSIQKYEDASGLSFYYGNISGRNPQKDSVNYSFFIQKDNLLKDTVWLRVETMGLPSDEDRPVSFMQLQEEGELLTAQSGVHYLPFDSPELQSLMVVKKNQVQADVPVILLRDKSLKTAEYRLLISIAPNDCFQHGIERYQTFLIKITDTAQEPPTWSSWKYQFGDFGPVKLKFLIDYVGIDFSADYPSYMIEYYGNFAKEKLEEYKSDPNNEPLVEEDGTEVTFN